MWKALLLTTSLLLVPACGDGTGPDPAAPDTAPKTVKTTNVVATDLAGIEKALADRKGKALLVNFWAIWCAPCVAELPDLQATADAFADKNAEVVTVSYDLMMPGVTREDAVAEMTAFLEKKGYRFPVHVFDADDYDGINARFQLPGDIPVTLVINTSGEIIERHEGKADQAQFTAMLDRALK